MEARKPMSRKEQSGGWLETAKTVVYAVLIAIVARTFAFEPFSIPSGSMIPTLLVDDYLFVSKYSYGYSKHSFPLSMAPFSGRIFEQAPQRGDVAVFKWPGNNRTDYIKRIIGIGGDRVQVIGGVLHINGKAVEIRELREGDPRPVEGSSDGQSHLYVETLPGGTPHVIRKKVRIDDKARPCGEKDAACNTDNTKEYLVPQGHVFVMGDNRDDSSDSRDPQSKVGFVPVENLVGRAEFIFYSHDGTAEKWEVWKWPGAIRFGRLFKAIR